jgi:hypothetical protein
MINLEGLLKVIVSGKVMTINLFNENDLLLISFGLPGYDCLDDFLLDDEVKKIELVNVTNVNITIDTSNNEP